jgi:hypothetical protein
MAMVDHIKVRAKVVLVVSHQDHWNLSKEESQSTLKFDINQTFISYLFLKHIAYICL